MNQFFSTSKLAIRILITLSLLVSLAIMVVKIDPSDAIAFESGFSIRNSGLEVREFERCRNSIDAILRQMPSDLTEGLEQIIIHSEAQTRRGLATQSEIYLRCLDDKTELQAVFVHELAHIIELNWFSETELTDSPFGKTTNRNDYVSGYAMSDRFEDFAESFALYYLYGQTFRQQMQGNEQLEAKYNFVKYHVFAGAEFQLGKSNQRKTALISDIFDITKLHTFL
ncbi:hypothetical protein KA036_01215 [Candidatus Gracilibacteria bacterium]|jgi:hypothetical protein|nr:hypothetical protein [Candidatus Gracilibacteria bacterium]